MPNFKLTEIELITRLDKWLYFIKNLEDFQTIPEIFADEVFSQAFEKAEIAKFGQSELDSYEYSLKVFRDNKAVYDYAIDTAFDQGKLEGKIEIAKSLKRLGVPTQTIIDATGLTSQEIENL
jgi:predicted transposase/invertase (TIGR01784 family)